MTCNNIEEALGAYTHRPLLMHIVNDAMDWHTFSKVLHIVASHSKCTREMTFSNFSLSLSLSLSLCQGNTLTRVRCLRAPTSACGPVQWSPPTLPTS